MELTDAPLLFDAAVKVVDEDGTVTAWVHAPQFFDDPEGVFAELREHLQANTMAYRRPSQMMHLVRPRSAPDGTAVEAV